MIDGALSGAELTITAAGDLDLAERAQFPPLVALVEAGGLERVVVDLCAVGFVDSSGAGFWCSWPPGCGATAGRAVLRGADEGVLYVLRVCGALAAFDVDASHRCPPTSGRGPWRVDRG